MSGAILLKSFTKIIQVAMATTHSTKLISINSSLGISKNSNFMVLDLRFE